MKNLRILLVFAGLACLSISLTPMAKAGDWDEKTMLTFSEPVEIPGVTLPAGSYIFKLLGSPVDRNLVQVLSADERKVYATIHAIPNFRWNTVEKTTIVYEAGQAGAPHAIKRWFFPAYSYGHEFVYWNAERTAPGNSRASSKADESSSSIEQDYFEPEYGTASTQQTMISEESDYMRLLRERQQQ